MLLFSRLLYPDGHSGFVIMFIFIFVCFCLLLLLIFKYSKFGFSGNGKKVPASTWLPIFGHTLLFANIPLSEYLNKMVALRDKFGEIYHLDLGFYKWHHVSDPNLIEIVANHEAFQQKANGYNVTKDWLGNGLLTSMGHQWFSRRKALTPAFHFKILEKFVLVMNKQSDILLNRISEIEKLRIDNHALNFDLFDVIKSYTLDVICETSMGVCCEAQSGNSDYARAIDVLSSIANWRLYHSFASYDWYFKWTKEYKMHIKNLAITQNFVHEIIEKRRKEIEDESQGENEENVDDVGSKKKMTLLEILLKANIEGKYLTNQEVAEEVNTFMFAGHDTTASAFCFLIYNLAKHPEIQNKVAQEVEKVFGTDKAISSTLSDLCELKYLEMVVKESLRMYPPVPFISRFVPNGATLGEYNIPKGHNTTMAIYLMHNNPKYFPEPDKFIPERFDRTVDAEKFNPYTYIPFSAGPRNCIGQKFAMIEIKLTISKIIQNYKILLEDESYKPVLLLDLILKTENIPIKFVPK